MEEEPVELAEDMDMSKDDIVSDDILEAEATDVIDLLADEPKDALEIADEDDDFRELEMLMDPYELNDY